MYYKEGNLSPSLAKDLPKVSKNGLLIDIPLKENISFHDGTIFNAGNESDDVSEFELATAN